MEIKDYSIMIATRDEFERPYAEVFYKGELWVEIYCEGMGPCIRVYAPEGNAFWDMPYEEAMAVLERAKKWLLEEEG